MKLNKTNEFFLTNNTIETIQNIRDRFLKNPLAIVLLLTMSLNLVIAPAVMAASGNEITKNTAYAIAILYCVTIALSIYLFTVIFQPERF
ncbi:K+-transporting ATPase, F subunit [Stanieria cyanosphaera PCC 7437]|uniref:K+-transporting ATPase, F subunit n=1 Tax=Stanieria cyanosphaera (strain ATCC 29371 / PCC 7437) TaxID=111780 RepID=K9XY12_STAC7|nr:potassium-transporting ATPase subunit F [Stanieria cyanosphaera]AFZ37490.1 K+-transporting ATPase, F subunit [Stanieria cyanosphaera PCC 7437]